MIFGRHQHLKVPLTSIVADERIADQCSCWKRERWRRAGKAAVAPSLGGDDVSEPITVCVTPVHITEAYGRKRQRDYDPGADCPIAVAVDERLHAVSSGKRRRMVYVTSTSVQWFRGAGMYREFELPTEAKIFVQQYDKGARVKPLSFDLRNYQDKHILAQGIVSFPRFDGQGNVTIWFE